jgi:aminobutyraldehyde dehydrogenase
MKTNLLINNKSVLGEADGYDVINPVNSEIITSVTQSSVNQVNEAVTAAKIAFTKWSRISPAERSGMLLKLADVIDQNAEEIAKLESLNTGKPYHLALNDELPAISDVFRYYAGACRNLPGYAAGEYMTGFTSMVRRDPIGVVASIAPWNYPLMMAAWKIAPAIAAGNTMVLKPSEQTPLSTLFVAELIAGIFPEGVINIVHGIGETVGSTLINHPDINMISLTGDIATGSKVLEAASNSIKKTHLELEEKHQL